MFRRLKSAAHRPTTCQEATGDGAVGMMPTDDNGFSLIPKGTNGLVTEGADLATDFIPGVSNVKDVTAAITGVNPVTGEKLNTFERIASGVFAIPGIGNAWSPGAPRCSWASPS